MNEISATVGVFSVDTEMSSLSKIKNRVKLQQTIPMTTNDHSAFIDITDNYLCTSNRGSDTIAVFKILENGFLKGPELVKSGGKTPRNFSFSPDRHWMVVGNQNSDNISVMRFDAECGKLAKQHDVRINSPNFVYFLE